MTNKNHEDKLHLFSNYRDCLLNWVKHWLSKGGKKRNDVRFLWIWTWEKKRACWSLRTKIGTWQANIGGKEHALDVSLTTSKLKMKFQHENLVSLLNMSRNRGKINHLHKVILKYLHYSSDFLKTLTSSAMTQVDSKLYIVL